MSRIKHKTPDAQYQGIMLVNPGGPGGSGLTLSVLGEYVPNGAGDAYDWIGFDPRGVGSSEPALACDGSYFSYNRPYYVPVTKALEKTWLKRSKGYAIACDQAGGDLLDHLKTTDSLNGVACTDDKIAAYLATGALPPRVAGRTSDVKCDPVPRPEPAVAALRSAAPKAEASTADGLSTREDPQKLIGSH